MTEDQLYQAFVKFFDWGLIFALIGLSVFNIMLGFRMGRMSRGEQQTTIFQKKAKPAAYEDEPGGLFEDHMSGGKYDQIEQAEETGRIKTI